MERMISSEEGKRLADSWKAAFLETSAKQNEVWLCNFSLLSDYSMSISCTRVRTEGSDHNDRYFLGCGVMLADRYLLTFLQEIQKCLPD